MRRRVNVLLACGALVALAALLGSAAPADADGEEAPPRASQGGENQWVPSLAISGGAIFQTQNGRANSVLFQGMVAGPPTEVPLQGKVRGDDFAVAPFVGASLEVMSPALPVPTRPRFFASGEILPTFGPTRNLVSSGDPGCIRGPEADAPCATDEGGARVFSFDAATANGQGTEVTSEITTLTWGASLGVSFPFNIGERQLRIRPYASWLSYEIESTGLVVDAQCTAQCTTTNIRIDVNPPGPGPEDVVITRAGFLRQPESITASASKRFHGIGPGLDIEVDTGRFGPIGTSLFVGARAYNVLGDRTLSYGTSVTYPTMVPNPLNPPGGLVPDPICSTAPRSCPDSAEARFKVDVSPWIYRAHVGIRFQWLGGWD